MTDVVTTQTPGPAAAAPESPSTDPGLQSKPGPPQPSGPTGPKPGGPTHPPSRLPRLADVRDDAVRYLKQALNVLLRERCPAFEPGDDHPMGGPGYVHSRLLCATAEVRHALDLLGQITDGHLPPAVPAPALCTAGPGGTPCLLCRARVSG